MVGGTAGGPGLWTLVGLIHVDRGGAEVAVVLLLDAVAVTWALRVAT